MIVINIDKETQNVLLALREDATRLNNQIQHTILTYLRASGNSTDKQYSVSEDFSTITEVAVPEQVSAQPQVLPEG